MKRFILLACCIGWVVPAFASDTGLFNKIPQCGSIYVLYADSRASLIEHMRENNRKYGIRDNAMVLELTGGGETLTYTIKTPEDAPEQSVKVDCPRSYAKECKCWFVEYGK